MLSVITQGYECNSLSQSTCNETAEPDLRKPGGHHASCGAQLGHFGRRFSSVSWESVSLAGALAGESSSEATSGAVFVNISCGVYFPCSVLALKCWPQRFSGSAAVRECARAVGSEWRGHLAWVASEALISSSSFFCSLARIFCPDITLMPMFSNSVTFNFFFGIVAL